MHNVATKNDEDTTTMPGVDTPRKFGCLGVRGALLKGATRTVCNVSHDWPREQKTEQQKNAPNPKKQCSCRLSGSSENSVMPALKRTRLTASAWRKANWCINCVLMRVMERRERDNS